MQVVNSRQDRKEVKPKIVLNTYCRAHNKRNQDGFKIIHLMIFI